MKCLSQEKMVDTIKRLRTEMQMSQDELGNATGINRQMIGRLERNEYMPSILQLEALAKVLNFDITSLYEESEPMVCTAFRSSSMSEEEQKGVNHMFEMMMASKQQLLLRKAMQND